MLSYTNLLLRRLAYVPWLMVAGLVLGGAEKAAAQTIRVYNAVATEGQLLEFTVAMSPADDKIVTVNYAAGLDGGEGTAAEIGDFTAASGTLTFFVGEQIKTVYVQTTPDVVYEGNETFSLTLSNAQDASAEAVPVIGSPATGTILEDDLRPSLTVADASGTEGGLVIFTVELSGVIEPALTVNYSTSAGTATSSDDGSDFTETSGTLTIPGGLRSGIVYVPTSVDNLDEADETFTLTLASPDPATSVILTDAVATGTILDSNISPVLSVADASGTEGGPVSFTVALVPAVATGQAVTVSYLTSAGTATSSADGVGADFTATSGTLTITTGATSGTITVLTTNDNAGEADETFTLTLSSPTGATLPANPTATGTITDNDAPALTVAAASGVEGSSVDFTVTLVRPTGQLVLVSYATSAGTATSSADGVGADFTATSGTLTIAAGATSGTVSVPTTGDTVDESNETFTLVLSNPSANVMLATATVTGTITDNDDPLSLSVANAEATEGDAVNFTLTLSRAVSTETVLVSYATAPGTATSADFAATSGTLTFAANEISKRVSVLTTGDTVDESNETFTLVLSNPSADVTLATATVTGTITDNDGPPALSVAAASGNEGDGLVIFTVKLEPASGQLVTVSYTTAPGTATSADFTATSGTLTFAVGALSRPVPVVTTDDNVHDPNETFSLLLSNPVGATLTTTNAMATGTIIDNEASPVLSVADTSGTEGGPVVFTVSLSPATGQDVTVAYATAFGMATSADFTATAGVLTIAAGATSGTVSVPTVNDFLNEDSETFTLTLSSPSTNATIKTGTATGTIEDDVADGAITLTVNPSSVREDAGVTNITVKAQTPSTVAADTYITLSLAAESVAYLNTRFRITLPTLRIPQGEKETMGTITFTPIDDAVENNDLPITITGSAGAGSVGGTTIELVDDDKLSTQINLSFSDASIGKSDGTTDVVVSATLNGNTLTQDLAFALTVDEDFAGSAERDVDYTVTMAPVIIPDRRVSGTATITIRPRNVGTGIIRVVASTNPTAVDGRTITVNGASIELTGDPARAITGLTATPFSIREDAGPKVITLEVTLQNALVTDEIVQFTISDDSDIPGDDFQGAVAAQRDVDYSAIVEPLIIPKGETKGTTTMTVTPRNNNNKDDPRAFMVNARVGNNPLFSTGILITDDDTTSDSITLEVSPTQITEGAGPTAVTVTGTLQGKVFNDNVVVALVINDDINGDGKVDAADKAATRDLDYTAVLSPLVIPGGATQGTATLSITPIADNTTEGDERIGLSSLGNPRAIDEDGDIQELTVAPVAITLKDSSAAAPATPADPTRPTFAAADSIANQSYAVGTAINPLVLPEAMGGNAPLTYSVSTLPAGLSFDSATRTLSGTPTAETAGAVTIFYTVIDNDWDASVLIFTIAVEEAAPPPPVADAQLMASPSSIREDAGTTQVALTVTLAAARATDEIVTFTVATPSEGRPAVRDVDYTAALGTMGAVVSIPAGATIGTATLTLTPINNAAEDGLRAIGVQATFASGATLLTDIKIVDDETPSTAIVLSANPNAIVEGSGTVEVTVTATLNGKALAAAATVVVVIDPASTATRDVDYAALFNPLIVIPAGMQEGSTIFAIRTISDDLAEGSETIKLLGVINGLEGDEAEITLSDRAGTTPGPDGSGDGPLAFATNTVIPNQTFTAGTAITPLVLPAASGGVAPLTYSVSALPAGLVFDAATRTIVGTPTTATNGAVIVIYTVVDSQGGAAVLTFSITVNEGLTFGDFFNFGAGKVVPTAAHDLVEIREFVVGQRVEDLTLPEAAGGTAPLTYQLSPALPAGLVFDAATRTIVGTPQAASETAYTYTVTDANGATAALALQTLPTAFSLADNFPNPFNPATTIQYALPQAGDVELVVYNVLGQPVRTLVAEHQNVGRYAVEWDATNDSGHSLSSGMYLYRLQVDGEFREVKKMLLLK